MYYPLKTGQAITRLICWCINYLADCDEKTNIFSQQDFLFAHPEPDLAQTETDLAQTESDLAQTESDLAQYLSDLKPKQAKTKNKMF